MEKNVAEKKGKKNEEKREKQKENVQFWCGSLDAFLHRA